jgi:glycosyltransferase involved in cell wall biosynthesis
VAILRLLDDRELAQRMGRANRLWAETLTWDRNAQEQMSAYQDVLGA